jgi:hypothetical protein
MRRCPECGQENPAGARFCNSCGRELTAARARSGGDWVLLIVDARQTLARALRAAGDAAGAEREERLAAAAATKGLSAAAYTPGIEPYEEAHDG